MTRFLAIIAFLFIILDFGFGQVLNFRTFFVEDGLAQSQVTAIDDDQFGNIWLATYGGGVDCFDGLKFKNFGLPEGMSHHQVLDIYVDDHNAVWCALQRGGVNVIKNNEVKALNLPDISKAEMVKITGNNNGVFCATKNGNLYKTVGDSLLERIYAFTNTSISDLCVHQDNILVGTKNKGLWIYENEQMKSLADVSNITDLYCQKDKLWIGAGRDLYSLSLQTMDLQFEVKAKGVINDISTIEKDKIVWLSIYGAGLGQYSDNRINYITEKNGLSSNYTNAIFEDQYGLIWVGTDGSGLNRFSGFQFVHYSFNLRKSGEAIMDIIQQNNALWFATYGNGIIKKTGKNIKVFDKSSGLPSNRFYALEITEKQILWAATRASGLVRMNLVNNEISTYNISNSILSNNLLHITKDAHNNLLVSSRDKGLFIQYKNKWIQISPANGLPDNHINYMLFDKSGHLWLATASSGIVKIEKNELYRFLEEEAAVISYEIFNMQEQAIYQQVFTLAQDKNGLIWYGLFGGGVGYIKDGEVKLMAMNRKLNSRNVYGLVYDRNKNILWVSTDKGLASVRLSNQSVAVEVQTLSAGDGFIGVECNRNALMLDTLQRTLWAGTVKGVTRFMPEAYNPPDIAPRLMITNFSYQEHNLPVVTYKNDSGIDWDKAPVIPYDSNNVAIHFKGIDQWQPKEVRYQWILVGLNDKWHDLAKQQVTEYTYLPSGKYIFKLKALSGRGKWSDYSLSLPFVVNTPFYRTRTFYILLGFFFLSAIALYVYFRQLNLQKRNRKLREAVMERTEALNNEKLIVEQQKEELRAQTEHLERANHELEKLSLVASKTDNAVLIADKVGRWEWINEGFTKMYGYSLHEFIQERGETILTSSTSSKISHILDEAVHLKKSVTYTTKGFKRDSTEMWVQSTLTPVFDEQGELKRFVVIDTDITHIKRINNELRKLSLVASKTDNSVIMMNGKGKIEWVNDAFHRFYDLSLEEFKTLYQKTIFDLHEDVEDVFSLEEIVQSRKSQAFVSSFITRKGVHKWIQSVVTPVFGIGYGNEQLIAIETDITRIKEVEEEVKAQRKKSDELLLNILPAETAEELKSQGVAQPRFYNSASVLFSDFKNFTAYCEELSPKQLVYELREYFDAFDDIVENYYVEKIKIIGDAYMCAGGLPIRNRSHPFDIVLTAMEIQRITSQINAMKVKEGRHPWELRIGVHTGDLVAGVVGKKKFAYDIWGETVNIASRMEGACEVGRINISGDTYEIIKDFFTCTYRGNIDARNIGKYDMYFVEGIKPEYSIDGLGAKPNRKFKEYLAKL